VLAEFPWQRPPQLGNAAKLNGRGSSITEGIGTAANHRQPGKGSGGCAVRIGRSASGRIATIYDLLWREGAVLEDAVASNVAAPSRPPASRPGHTIVDGCSAPAANRYALPLYNHDWLAARGLSQPRPSALMDRGKPDLEACQRGTGVVIASGLRLEGNWAMNPGQALARQRPAGG